MASLDITRRVPNEEGPAFAPSCTAPSPCPLCDAVLATFASSKDNCSSDLRFNLADLDGDCPHNAWLKTAPSFSSDGKIERLHLDLWKISLNKELYGRTLALLLEHSSVGDWHCSSTFDAELVRWHDVDGHMGSVYALDPAWIDLDVARSWCARCPQDHGPECDVVRIPGTDPIRPRWLIDIKQSCIVPGSSSDLRQEDNARYLALSYTWGLVDDAFRTHRGNLAQVRTPGALLHPEVVRRIPATVRDAIGLTKELGERYLWVDSLCIVQDDNQALDNEPRQMHRIYSSAFLTIVAKDGEDASAGLRGIRGVSALPRRSGQTIFPLRNGERLSVIEPKWDLRALSGLDAVSPSSYDSRMWTFQEEMFARRRLVFKDGRAGWECPRASWREHLDPDVPAEHHSDLWLADRLPHEWMATGLPNLLSLQDMVSRFNRRALTNEADCLNAFSGLQTALGHIYIGGFLLGIPELFFDIYLLWVSLHSVRRAPRQVYGVAGKQGTASPGFMPSWSWMGWHGQVSFPIDRELSSGFNGLGYIEPLAEWYVMPGPEALDQRRRIQSEWYVYHQMAQRGDLTPELDAAGWFLPSSPPSPLEEITWSFDFQTPNQYCREYTHTSPTGVTSIFNYPFPTMETAAPVVREQYRYLVAKVQITEFELTSSPLSWTPWHVTYKQDRLIQDREGSVVGCLGFERSLTRDRHRTTIALKTEDTVRLVAVVRGWISLDPDSPDPAQPCAAEIDAAPDYTGTDTLDPSPHKKECYHVLCVERDEDGVHSRIGSGWVFAEAWRNAEKEDVEMVLA